MNVFRTRPNRDFTTIRNAAIRDPRLSGKAKGYLVLLLSFPDDWQFYESHLLTLMTDGRSAFRSGIRELEAAGYLLRRQERSEDGKLGRSVYYVSDIPNEQPEPQERVPDDIRTVDRKSVDGKSVDGKSPTTKTEETKTYYTKKDLKHSSENDENAPPQIAKSPRGDARATPADLQNIWNEHRGNLPAAQTLKSDTRRSRLAKIIEKHGREATAIFRAAVQQVATDDFWIERGYGIDNLLAGEKYISKAEAWHQNQHVGGARNRPAAVRSAKLRAYLEQRDKERGR